MFFFLCLVAKGGRKGLRANFTENTASSVYWPRKINPLIVNSISAKLIYFIISSFSLQRENQR